MRLITDEQQAKETYHLPELDSSLPDNDLGGMVSAILIVGTVIGLLLWSLK